MPMDMRKLIPEEFVVHLLCVVGIEQDVGYPVDLLDQLKTFGGCELEELGGMALEDHDGPAREELVIVEIGLRQSKVGNKMVLSRPGARASLA